eukprot:1201172-Amphidinium_carterae.1
MHIIAYRSTFFLPSVLANGQVNLRKSQPLGSCSGDGISMPAQNRKFSWKKHPHLVEQITFGKYPCDQ